MIHAHVDWLFPWLDRLGVPFVTTPHDRLDVPGLLQSRCAAFPMLLLSRYPTANALLGDANWLGIGVPMGFLAKSFCPILESGSYLAFLGRLSADKGLDAAIRIARAAGMPLRIAGPHGSGSYFKDKVQPEIDGEQVRLSGEVNDTAKERFLAGAAALLFPMINWPEPFGLVMIEAMACGTPVIAYRSGAAPEVVEDGVTGYVASCEAEAVEAISHLGKLDRCQVRGRFEQRFSSRRMAQEYLGHYERLVTGRPRSANSIPTSRWTPAILRWTAYTRCW